MGQTGDLMEMGTTIVALLRRRAITTPYLDNGDALTDQKQVFVMNARITHRRLQENVVLLLQEQARDVLGPPSAKDAVVSTTGQRQKRGSVSKYLLE